MSSPGEWTSIGAVVLSAVSVIIAIATGFGRRQRLKFAVEVRGEIAPDQRAQWSLMIDRDAAAILRASTRPIPVLAFLVPGYVVFAAALIPGLLPPPARSVLMIVAMALFILGLAVGVVYSFQDRRRSKTMAVRTRKLAEMNAEQRRRLAEQEREQDREFAALQHRFDHESAALHRDIERALQLRDKALDVRQPPES